MMMMMIILFGIRVYMTISPQNSCWRIILRDDNLLLTHKGAGELTSTMNWHGV